MTTRLHAFTSDREWLTAGTSVEGIIAILDTLPAEEYTFVTIETPAGDVVARHTIGTE